MKGPLLNDNHRRFTTRNSLGIEDVAASISADICPIVNIVTPRAFYWPFMAWLYYDFYKYSGIADRNDNEFNFYVKRQDYFFVLSQLLSEATDQNYLVGKDKTGNDMLINPVGPFPFNRDYFVARYGGMQYYRAGLLTMGYIIDEIDGKPLSFPKLTRRGEEMALAFQTVIKNTAYYKTYRLQNTSVPKDVLIEYGKVINIGLNGFEACKADLRERIENIPMLKDSASYLKYIFSHASIPMTGLPACRRILFDLYSPRGDNEPLNEDLRVIAKSWEIVIGRQYFTCGLEAIWKYMLFQLRSARMTKKEWIAKSIASSAWKIDLERPVEVIIPDCSFDYSTREELISRARLQNHPSMVEDGLRIVLSTYNQFNERSDYTVEGALLTRGNDSSSISFEELIRTVEKYRSRPVREFLEFIMDTWLIEQHYITALEKLMRSVPLDGFYYELADGYYRHRYDFSIDFQGIRLYQLSLVMKDLNML